MPFSAVWNNIIAQAVKAAGHDPDELYAKVCDSLRKIDTGNNSSKPGGRRDFRLS